MVAIIGGMRAGLNLGSREVLGQAGIVGNPLDGRNGQGVYVNAAKGLLVVQAQDDYLAGRGIDSGLLRTYNSSGSLNDDNGDGWLAGMQMLRMTGTVNTAGSTISRYEADGGMALYTFDGTKYVTTEGAGAHDSITYVAADSQFEWRDGATGATQRFEGSGSYRLLLARDTSGNVLTYAYGANGFLSSVTTANGETTFYDYTGNNLSQVRSVVAGGATTTRVRYAYDASNRLTSVTVDLTPGDNSVADGKVYQTTYTYDGTSKRVATINQTDGTSLTFTYVDVGGGDFRVATVRDGLNQTSAFSYGAGYTTVTDAAGLVTRYDYDASSQLTKITAPATGGTTPTRQFTYNASGDVTSVIDGEGRTVTFQYDANGNQVLQRDQAGNTVTRTYDARNQLLTETVYLQPDPDGAGAGQPGVPQTTRHVYDATGRNLLRFTVSAEGRVTEHRYNAFGERVASITYAAGQYPVSGLAAGASLAEADLVTWAGTQNLAAIQRVDYAYDGRGQLQTRTTYARTAANGDGIADGSQSAVQYVYDQAGLLLQTIAAGGGTTSYTYDGLGRVLTATDAKNQVTVTQYADALRKTTITLASGLVTTSSYDAAGRLVSVARTDAAAALLGETKYFYDASNRLRMTQDPTGVRTWMLYDAAGRKVADIDGTGTMTEYTYDGSGLLTYQVTYATAVNTAALVNGSGLPVTTVTAATVRPATTANDQREWRSYDAAQRLFRTGRSYGQYGGVAVTENRYDGASRLVEVVAYANALTAGTASVTPGAIAAPATAAADRSTRNFYGADGRLAGTLDGEGYLTVFQYDSAGRLVETLGYATATTASLRATGTLAQLLPVAAAGDVRSVNLYDGKGQLVGAVDAEGYLTEYVYDKNGNATQTVRYANRVTATVTPASSLAAIRPAASAADRGTVRTYDALNRVTQETNPEGVVTQYTYDVVGNLTSTLRAVGTTELRTLLARYDLQGRLVAELSAEGAALLTGSQTQAEVDAIWAQYGTWHGYDAAGRRISTTDAYGNRTLFFYNADGALTHTVNALGEVRENRYDAMGRVISEHVYAMRISTIGLTGGLVTTALTNAVTAIASSLDVWATYTYTTDNRKATEGNGQGSTTYLTYNVFGETTAIDQGLGGGLALSQTFGYDRRGLRTSQVLDAYNSYGLQTTLTTEYDAFGRAIRSVDGKVNVRLQTYDRLGRQVTAQDPLNALRSSSYDAFGRVLTQTDPLGRTTTFAYDATARTMTVTTPEGIVTTTAYTRHGQVQSITDGKGQVTSYTYDRNGNLKQTSTPLTTATNNYDRAGRLVLSVDAAGTQVAYAYDAASRVLTRRVDPDGLNLVTTYGYDGKGQAVSVTDPNGVVTTRTFDNKGNVLREAVDPTGLNLQTVYTYDAVGKVLTVTSPAGSVTQYVYDVLGRRTQERVDPAGLNLTRSWTYDKNGNAVTSTDARGNVTRYAYDANDRLVYTVDPLGNVQENSYDAAGRVVKSVAYATPISLTGLATPPTVAAIQARVASLPAKDRVEHRVYDRDGRLTTTVDGTGGVIRFAYDANGNVVTRTAYANRVDLATWTPGTEPTVVADAARDAKAHTVYDALNRATYSVDGVGAVVAHTYDGNGQVLRRTAYATAIPTSTALTQSAIAAAVAAVANPARDAVVRNVYDAAGRLTWSADGTGAVTQRIYDKNGNIVRQVAYATAIAASALPSSVTATAQDRSTAMAYDAANRLVLQVDALRGVTEQVLDADGRVVRRIQYANPIASIPALGTAGTAAAIRAAVTPNAAADRSVRYGYDAAGRHVLTIDPLGAVTESRYDAAGNVTSQTAYAALVNTGTLGAAPTLAAMKALITANAQADRTTKSAWDAAGRLAYQVDALGAVTSTHYDGVGRVVRTTRYANPIATGTDSTTAAISGAVQADATRDQTTAYGYNAAGQLTSTTDAIQGAETYSYDAVGRKLSFVNKRGFTWTYTYDAAGRMLTETTPQVALATVTTDGAGNLVASAPADAAIVTRLAYDALGNLTERTEALGRTEQRITRYEYDALDRQVRVIYPPVGVYNAAGDNVTTNGATSVASRVETTQTLETRTFYDTLGNAVANRDVGGALSQKVYDLLGRVVYEVDAMGYVTGYGRDAFGDVTTLARYGVVTTLANGTVTQASQAVTRAQVEAVVNGTSYDHSKDRLLLNTYDRAGRVLESSEPSGYVYDTSAAAGLQTATAARKTRNTYDAFGQLVQSKVARNEATGTWATTTHYFDLVGREFATIDALGYLTRREFDTMGNLQKEVQYATAVASGWTIAGYALPADVADDRTTTYAYDLLNRKTSESRLNVEHSTAANGTSTRGTLTTTYGYDALGNQTVVTDADNKSTFTYYDALGRIRAVAAPARSSTLAGTSLTPLTEFRRDAHGNVLAKIDYANGAASATATTYTAGAADAVNDRRTLAAYDSFGRAIQGTNANGASDYTSYDAYGHVAKRWQGVTGNDGVTRTAFEQHFYDKLGQLVESRTPASTSVYTEGSGIGTVTQAQAGTISTALEYNAFGEVTRKGVQGGRQEYFDYDNAGRLWRTNTGDGVDRIYLYDTQGNQTAEIRSSGTGGDNYDIKGLASAQAANDRPNTRRYDIQYDLMGRVTARTEAARQELQGGVSVRRQFTTASIGLSSHTQVDENSYPLPGAKNRVTLGWNDLTYLGSGDVKVTIEYRTPLIPIMGGGESPVIVGYTGGTPKSYTSGIFVGDAHSAGLTAEWLESGGSTDIGIGTITRMVVYKKDINGEWRAVIDQAPGYGTNEITVAAPPDPGTGVTLQLRAAGSAGDTGWWTAAPLFDFGNSYRLGVADLTPGSYEYRVTVSPPNGPARVTGTGTVAITQQPLNSINANMRYGAPGVTPGVMVWDSPPAGTVQTFRYRVSGSTGGWSTLTVTSQQGWMTGPVSGIDTRGVPAGSYQFELLWAPAGHGVATSHATGTFTVVAEVPPQWVPPVNLPHIHNLSMGTGVVGGTYGGLDENGHPIYYGGTTVPALVWSAANANVARYRSNGGAWNYLNIDSYGQYSGESGWSGIQKAALNGIPPGTYEVQIFAGSPPSAQATGNFTIYAQNPGYYEQVSVQVPVYTPVIAYWQKIYETRYGVRTVSYEVQVPDYTRPVMVTVWDESGPHQVPARDESGNIIYHTKSETRYREEGYYYQVEVGQTPVYARDENGAIIYSVSYRTETQQVWRPGTTPAPTVQVTTPPYTAGYWTNRVPAQYGVSVTTPGGSVAISTSEHSQISQSAGVNGDNRTLRPTVYQKTDRWGNVLEITDPRASYWKTTYKYNANNQLVQQTQPDAGGGAPVTSVYYDKLGRQVAVRDAKGNVNGQVFDAGGNLVQEVHADGGVITHAYNAFGDKLRTVDAENRTVTFGYDRMGHMLSMAKGQAGVYSTASNVLQYVQTRNITDTWTYDQLGRKLSQTNGNGEQVRYTYDLRGNVVETWQPLGQVLRNSYDFQGRKTGEVDANGYSASWTYNYFGQLTAHKDLGGATYAYTYDNARQLTAQSSSRGQSITYTYDTVGQVTQIYDANTGKVTTYAYDLSGRKLRERVVQGGITYQDNHLAYDARGNLRDVADARVHISMDYDLVGNRTRVSTYVDYQGVSGEAAYGSHKFFQYDAMNRQVIVDAVDAAGNLGQQGHAITYDKNGNRTSDTYWGPKVVTIDATSAFRGFDENGVAMYWNTPVQYVRTDGYTREDYRYDNLNRLQSVMKDDTQIDMRYYDGADRVLQSGPAGNLPVKYSEIINAGVSPEEMNGKEMRTNRYDANGRLMHQTVRKSDNTLKLNISWDPNEPNTVNGNTYYPDGYDAAGNVRGYTVTNHEAGIINEYSTSLVRFEGYQASVTQGMSSKQLPGSTTQHYDANGFLVGITDSTQGNNNRTFVNDANGRALYVNQAGHVQRQLIVNGEVLGIYGAGVNSSNPASGYENNPNFANVVDFDFGYAKVSANYPSPSPGAYTVRSGDTLQSIAQGAYGDSSLWYRIAEANGLASSSDLKVGQTLNIPNRVSTIHNNSTTFKPYDPSEIEGDKTPSLATPKPKKKSWFSQLLMIVIVIIVTIYTAGALAAAGALGSNAMAAATLAGATTGGGIGATMAAGMSVMGGIAGAGAAVAAGAIGGAVGSLAGQVAGIAMGVQDSIDWKGVALSAISGGVSGGLAGAGVFAGAGAANAAARAALSSSITQGISVAVGLQPKFSWTQVAASAAGAGVGYAVGGALGMQDPRFGGRSFGEQLGPRLVAGLAAGLTTSIARGGKVSLQQVAVDGFGNVIADSLASTAAGTAIVGDGLLTHLDPDVESSVPSDPLGEFIEQNMPVWEQRAARYSIAGGGEPVGLRPGGGLGLSYGGVRANEADPAGDRYPGTDYVSAGKVFASSEPDALDPKRRGMLENYWRGQYLYAIDEPSTNRQVALMNAKINALNEQLRGLYGNDSGLRSALVAERDIHLNAKTRLEAGTPRERAEILAIGKVLDATNGLDRAQAGELVNRWLEQSLDSSNSTHRAVHAALVGDPRITKGLHGFDPSLGYDGGGGPGALRGGARLSIDPGKEISTFGRLGFGVSKSAQPSAVKVISTSSVDEQAAILSDAIPGLSKVQAQALLEASQSRGLEVVLGGSRVRAHFGQGTFRPDSDLDIGFNNANLSSGKLGRVLDKFDSAGQLRAERGVRIVTGNESKNISRIESPQEFFQRSGFRTDPGRVGEPFRPSGSITVRTNGTIIFEPPRF